MNIKRTLILTSVGAGACAVLRLLDFLLFYDGEFLKDNGAISLIGIGLAALLLIWQIILALRDKNCRTVYLPGRSLLRGIAALAAFLAAAGGCVGLWRAYLEQSALGVKELSATGLSMRLPFLLLTAFLALYLLVASILHLAGKEPLFARARLLELVPVLWGLIFVLYVFIHYSVSFMLSENLFVILSACALTLALTDKAKYLSAINEGGKGVRLMTVTGSLAVMLSVGYVLSNLVLALFSAGYTGDLPMEVQVTMLFLSLHVLAFMASSRHQAVEAPENDHPPAQRYK